MEIVPCRLNMGGMEWNGGATETSRLTVPYNGEGEYLGILFPQGSRNIHESMPSAAIAEWRRAGAIYNHMSAILQDRRDTSHFLDVAIAQKDIIIILLTTADLQSCTQITMDRLTQLQDTLDDVCDLCDKPLSNIGH